MVENTSFPLIEEAVQGLIIRLIGKQKFSHIDFFSIQLQQHNVLESLACINEWQKYQAVSGSETCNEIGGGYDA